MARAYTIALVLTWALSIVDGTIPSYWLLIHPFVGWWRVRSSAALKLLAFVWFALWGTAGVLTWPLRFHTFYRQGWTWLLGLPLWWLAFQLYRRGHERFSHDQLLGVSELRPLRGEQRLVATGIRGRMRHPVYTGHLCVLTGNCVASGLLANYLLLGWFLVTLPLMLHFEELELEKRFGDPYREYKARVPAIIPKLKSDV